MTTLAEHIIVIGAENCPPMLEKSMYDSWPSRIRLLIKGKKHGRMMLDSIDNGPLVYPTVKENRQTRPMKYSELTEAQQLQDDCDVQATNIILHGLPPDVYALVNHQEAAKGIWNRVKMLMKGTELSYQERECRLYNLFDKFAHVQDETLYKYYWRFSQLINDMHIIGMTMQQVQATNIILHGLPPDVLYNLFDKFAHVKGETLYEYYWRFSQLINDMHIIGMTMQQVQLQGFHHQTINSEHRLILEIKQPFKMVKSQFNKFKEDKLRVILVLETKELLPLQREIIQLFKEKLMLTEAQEAGQILDEENLAFLADPSISEAPVAQQTIPQNSAF
ncbi:hypothetical protein Tco_0731948 [Tanacetum coccineum]